MPGSKINIRVYNVRFGDCVLVSFDAGHGEKHVLIDFGNAPGAVKKRGGSDEVFGPVAADIKKRTGGTIDLLIMSHEHLDHMEGFLSQRRVFDGMAVRDVWMSLMSKPGYYARYPKCEPAKRARLALAPPS